MRMRFDTSLFKKTKILWEKKTPYQTIYVCEKGTVRYMRFASDNWQGALDMGNKDKILFPYQRFFLSHRAWLPEVRSFLSLGVGTGTAIRTIRRLHPDANITGVDLDSNVLQAAVKYFDCPCDEKTKLFTMHGRAFLESTKETYDLVFLDVFDSVSIPLSMRTIECFEQIRNVMELQGLLMINVIGTVRGSGSVAFRTLYKTVSQIFPQVWVLPVSYFTFIEQNVLIIAQKSTEPQPIRKLSEALASGVPEIKNIRKRLYTNEIPIQDVPVYRDLE